MLNLVAFDNEFACKSMSAMLAELIEFLPLNSPECGVSSLLKEVFRVIDPNIREYQTFFKNWVDRFEMITEENIH